MIILQALIAWLSKSLGDLLNTAFAWATLLLFGKVPSNRQIVLSMLSLLSLVWLVAALGTFFPVAAHFLLSYAPHPDWINKELVSKVSWIVVGILPFFNGVLSLFLEEKQSRPSTVAGWAAFTVNGWRLTLGLSITLALLIVIAPLDKLGEIIKQWKNEHVAVIIEPDCYGEVVDELERILETAGIKVSRTRPSAFTMIPLHLLAALAGKTLNRLVGQDLTKLIFEHGELEVRPSDLIVRGKRTKVNAIRSLILSSFCFGQAYLTWSKDANQIEDKMSAVWKQIKSESLSRSAALKRVHLLHNKLERAELAREEWEILFRLYLILKLNAYEGVGEIEKKAS